jgi:hypothetical protein
LVSIATFDQRPAELRRHAAGLPKQLLRGARNVSGGSHAPWRVPLSPLGELRPQAAAARVDVDRLQAHHLAAVAKRAMIFGARRRRRVMRSARW